MKGNIFDKIRKASNKYIEYMIACDHIAKEAQKYIEEGQFAKGSMLPKVEACMNFVKSYPEGKAIITSLDNAREALLGKTGTVIKNK